MTKYIPLAAFAAAFAVSGAWMLTRDNPSPSTAGVTDLLPGAAVAQEAGSDTTGAEAPQIDTSTVADMTLGNPDAPVTMIEYASFTCPHCAAFHANQFPQLKAEYIDTGLVHFIYREVYFDRYGLWASMVARCGGEARFFGISEILYETQSDWIAGGQDPALIAENLRKIGLTAGLDQAELEACMNDGTTAQTLYTWYQENAERDQVTSTPTLFIDGTKYSNMAFDELAALIDERLVAAGVEPPAN